MDPQTLQNSQILQPAERFSDVTGLCHHSVFGAKSAENGELRKVRFFVSDVESGARASKFACFPPKTGSRRSLCSEFRFLPRKACEFQPAEPVAACHRFVTARFLGAKVRKTGPSSRAPSPQGFSRPDSPPRSRLGVRQPAEVVRQPAELVTTALHPAPFLVQKSAQNVRVRRVRFSCRTVSGMPEPPNSQVWKAGSRRPLCSVFRFRAGKAANSSPPSMSPLVTASSPLSVSPPSLSPLKSPLHPAPFLVQKKRSKRSSPKSPFFVSDCKWDARASKFAGFRWKAGCRRPLCSVFRFRAGKAANSSPPSMSPLVTALSPLSLGPKSAQEACETSSASMGLRILVDPASSHMLVSKPLLKRSRARFLPGPPLITQRAMEPGDSSMAHE